LDELDAFFACLPAGWGWEETPAHDWSCSPDNDEWAGWQAYYVGNDEHVFMVEYVYYGCDGVVIRAIFDECDLLEPEEVKEDWEWLKERRRDEREGGY